MVDDTHLLVVRGTVPVVAGDGRGGRGGHDRAVRRERGEQQEARLVCDAPSRVGEGQR